MTPAARPRQDDPEELQGYLDRTPRGVPGSECVTPTRRLVHALRTHACSAQITCGLTRPRSALCRLRLPTELEAAACSRIRMRAVLVWIQARQLAALDCGGQRVARHHSSALVSPTFASSPTVGGCCVRSCTGDGRASARARCGGRAMRRESVAVFFCKDGAVVQDAFRGLLARNALTGRCRPPARRH